MCLLILYLTQNKKKNYIIDDEPSEDDEMLKRSKIFLNANNTNNIADINDDYILTTVHENIITPEEARYILEKSTNYFKDSVLVSGYNTNIRKSKTVWLNKYDPTIKKIIDRVCKEAKECDTTRI